MLRPLVVYRQRARRFCTIWRALLIGSSVGAQSRTNSPLLAIVVLLLAKVLRHPALPSMAILLPLGPTSPQNLPGGISSPHAWAVVSIITVLLVMVQTKPICISNIITSMDLTKHQ